MRLELEKRSVVDLVGVEIGADQRDLVATDGIDVTVILGCTRNWVEIALSLLEKESIQKIMILLVHNEVQKK
jgi:hypothetical protein